jgi:hypothetical protein
MPSPVHSPGRCPPRQSGDPSGGALFIMKLCSWCETRPLTIAEKASRATRRGMEARGPKGEDEATSMHLLTQYVRTQSGSTSIPCQSGHQKKESGCSCEQDRWRPRPVESHLPASRLSARRQRRNGGSLFAWGRPPHPGLPIGLHADSGTCADLPGLFACPASQDASGHSVRPTHAGYAPAKRNGCGLPLAGRGGPQPAGLTHPAPWPLASALSRLRFST